jgi:hypothetical protein
MTLATALAAPVEVGIMLQAGGPGPAQILVRQVEDALVVGVGVDGGQHVALGHAERLACMTLTAGARQLVVQEALETMWWMAGSYLSSFTPMTTVRSSSLDGAVMMTFLAPLSRCWPACRAGAEDARGFDDDVHAAGPQGMSLRVALGEAFDFPFAADADAFGVGLNRWGEMSVGRVVAQQVRVGLRVEEVVDGHDFQGVAVTLPNGLQDLAADAAEAVDADACLSHIPP